MYRTSDSSTLSKVFMKELGGAIARGYGFVPLVGGGLSVASGIPISQDILDYLFFRIKDAMQEAQAWNPRKWPLPPDKGEDMWNWIGDTVAEMRKDKKAQDAIKLEAVGSLANWVSALQFLTRIQHEERKGMTLGPPDYQIVDSYFRHITQGRETNAGHVMLAHLVDPLRIHTVLTTNFDSLIEKAFERLHIPLVNFDVHQKAPLPDAKSVLAQRSIIKLHGGRYGLRADFSLDESPSEADREAFAGYFAGASPANTMRHLLVIGLSGRDSRILDLVYHALDQHEGLDEDIPPKNRGMLVFWVCYNDDEIATVCERFVARGMPEPVIARHRDPALFLLELYQHVCSSLPPGGADYPGFWHVPPDPYSDGSGVARKDTPSESSNRGQTAEAAKSPSVCDEDAVDAWTLFEKRLLAEIKRAVKAKRRKIVRVRNDPNKPPEECRGMSSAASRIYDQLYDDHNCVWLDMDDFYDPSDFLLALREAAANRVGIGATIPPLPIFDPGPEERQEYAADVCHADLSQYVRLSRKDFVVFLQARDGFGVNAGTDVEGWERPDLDAFSCLLQRIWNPRITYILLIRGRYLQKGEPTVVEEWANDPETFDQQWATEWVELDRPLFDFDLQKIVCGVMDWLDSPGGDDDPEVMKRFLYAMTLFRHSRHHAALCSWALISVSREHLGPDTDLDKYRARTGRRWLEVLERHHAIRNKPGGFAWMHQDVKRALQEELEGRYPDLADLKPECHQGIADWYAKLFRSSGDPFAALESVYQRLQTYDRAQDTLDCPTRKRKRPLEDRMRHMQETALIETINTLSLARNRILSCGCFEAAMKVMDVIRDDLAEKLVQAAERTRAEGTPRDIRLRSRTTDLRRLCFELRRDFAGRMGRFADALERNQSLREFIGQSDQRGGDGSKERTQDRPGVTQLELALEEGIYLTGLRCYSSASTKIRTMLKDLGLTIGRDPAPRQGTRIGRELAKAWVHSQSPTGEQIELAIRALRRYTFLQMLIAQIHQFNRNREEQRSYLWLAEKLYAMSTEIMRYVDDSQFLQRENTLIRTNYSVVLSNLGRYREAHRRLNEATGYLSRSDSRSDPVTWAVIDLRRSEAYLDEAEPLTREIPDLKASIGEMTDIDLAEAARPELTDKFRRLFTLLDCAQNALERAEGSLAGQRTDVWWWTWMHALQLTICVYLSRLPEPHPCAASESESDLVLACTRCSQRYDRVARVFQEASRLIRVDVVRQAHLADLVSEFAGNEKLRREGSALEDLQRLRREAKKELERVCEQRLKTSDRDHGFRVGADLLDYVNGVRRKYRLGRLRYL